jgi:hypothetical protein
MVTEPQLEAFIMYLRKNRNALLELPKFKRGYSIGANETKIPDNYIECILLLKV